eukprot:10935-Heterococcus_DN1.PRE.2
MAPARLASLLAGVLLLIVQRGDAGDPLPAHAEHPFRHLAAWLREVEPEMEAAEVKAISRGITVLSKSQGTLKSFDGMAHELGGRFKTGTSTADFDRVRSEAIMREDKDLEQDALRLMELLQEVEKALSSAEVAECAGATDSATAEQYIADAGLSVLPAMSAPLKPVVAVAATPSNATATATARAAKTALPGSKPSATKVSTSSSSTTPKAEADSSVAEVKQPKQHVIGPTPLIEVPVGTNCTVRCRLLLDEKSRRVLLSFSDNFTGADLLRLLYEEPAALPLAAHGLVQETLHVTPAVWQTAQQVLQQAGPHIRNFLSSERGKGYSVHTCGHSFAGAVAAAVAGVLDGALAVQQQQRQHKISNSEQQQRTAAVTAAAGSAKGRVTCVTLGCPPCLSRAVRLPFVTSFVLGDDMVPRTSGKSLRRLKKRLLQVVPKNSGFFGQSFALGTSLFTDVAGVAVQSVKQSNTADADEQAVTVPGVWFLKPRRLHGGATMVRVRQGALRDDMLWQMHDIMLTKSMLSHHRLESILLAAAVASSMLCVAVQQAVFLPHFCVFGLLFAAVIAAQIVLVIHVLEVKITTSSLNNQCAQCKMCHYRYAAATAAATAATAATTAATAAATAATAALTTAATKLSEY